MARGKAAARKPKTKKHKAEDDTSSEPPAKLKREDSDNSKIRKAISEASKNTETKAKKYKVDTVLMGSIAKGEIYEDYTCMLNQTNIGHNNNKFYIIQVVKDGKKFICFTRWGRVGETGQNSIDYQDNAEAAIKAFKKKFKDKTKNDWDSRTDFTPHTGKYTLIEIDEDGDDIEEDDTDVVDSGVKRELVVSQDGCHLPYRTQIMIKLLFSDDMFISQMSSMKLDVKKMPLGKLSKTQINKGLETLLDIEEAIKNNKSRKVLMDLSSKFYTLVPHNFGRMIPPVLEDAAVVKEKKEVMLTLSDIELTQTLQKEEANSSINPILEKYQMLDCELEYVNKNDSEFKIIEEYAKACPNTRKGPLLDVWRLDRKGERDRFSAHEDIKHRKLLWHGTNVAVVAAILKAGLRIMPHSGGLVGRGIYFASEHAKSSWYVCPHYGSFEGEDTVGFMFLVEVALGKEHSITQCDGSLTKAPNGYDSIVARGQSEPDPKKDTVIELEGKNVTVPIGKPVPQKQWKNSGFSQSEYLVYKESQARLRYLLKFSFA
ncbi:protein mono-ADP-ribosyltransferase PARP3-like [Macrobrachium rosenbergii]|uniref:protein mono-ADP-ribosyltransferase PARP3-like n=1 Tax=Macrobrachium rosenbergii TaxID=79674 RepID=UPI0034D794AA